MSNTTLPHITLTAHEHGYYGKRVYPITRITIHHVAGIVTAESLGKMFQNPDRWACSNYGIGAQGDIGLYAGEQYACGTSGSWDNDNRAVTIEVSNDELGGEWHVSDKAYASLIDLVTDICVRNGIKRLTFTGDESGNLTCHYMFQATACPGEYLKKRMPEIARTVNQRLQDTEYDVNGDGKLNLTDVTTLQKVIARWKGIKYDKAKADINHDGKITLSDVTALLKYIAKGDKR